MNPEEKMKAQIGDEVAKQTAKKVGKVVGIVGATFAGVFFVIFLGFLFGWVIQFLWNYTLATMFDWSPISYWQAIALFVLAKFFFGFGHSGGHSKHKRKEKNDASSDKSDEKVREWWRRRMGMTPTDAASFTNNELFKKYWQEEGKSAYEAYAAANKEHPQNGAEK